ncbi:MAG: phosphomethylpyrimidine synthase ThiC [Aminobacteriaceae bacterium]
MTFKTQMQAARGGCATREMSAVAAKENVPVELILKRVAEGSVAIPANVNHIALSPEGVGKGLKTKVNVNLGISGDCRDYSVEMKKVRLALELGCESIMDLSNYGKTNIFRRELIGISTAMIGTVPIYDAVDYLGKELADITARDFLEVVEAHAEEGVDFMTIHAGINRRAAETFKRGKRVTNIVSRGGSLLFAWMEMTGNENPFFEYYDDLLEILRKYDVAISIGDALRPGSTADAGDAAQIGELIEMGHLARRAWKRDVQVIIEGPGHVAMDQIPANVMMQKSLCHNAPFYVLGPVVTDIAPGYDHITAAIGGAIAAAAGADFLCYVTPAEHLRLPDINDVREGIIACKIAAHAADIAKGISGARDIDDKMSDARRRIDWEEMFALALDGEKARRYFESMPPSDRHSCSMCGKMCAMRTTNRILDGEKVLLEAEKPVAEER